MTNQSQSHEENPLESFAAEMSEGLGGTPVELNETTVDNVEGGQIWMRQSAARTVQASALHMEESGAGLVRAGSVDVRNSGIGVVVANQLKVEESNGSFILAREVEARDVRAFAVFTSRVQGDVSAVFTPVTALAAGAGFAAALWLLRQIAGALNPWAQRRNQTEDGDVR